MRSKIHCSLVAFGVMALLAAVASAQTAAVPRPQAWQRWEHALTSARQYDNAYANVTLRVRYTGPDARTIGAYGFWDGGNVFRIRCAFPTPGTWQWETECSDASNAGLHGQRGSVEVIPYRGENLLYRRGFLKVSQDRRYLAYGDGTPFLWMGDTAWGGPMRATDKEWNTYLADRNAKHFTLIQVAPAPQWASQTNRQGDVPFHDKACLQSNPAFWQAFERKIQRANEAGFVVTLVGLMEPVNRYPESAAACLFARNIVARLFGNFVIFSPSFDSKFMPLANEVGEATRDATAVHLITQHPGTGPKQPTPLIAMEYYDRSYLDIAGVQTGHNGGDRQWCAHHAIEWILHAYRHEPHKPVINLEAMYDGQCEKAWQTVDARSLGWRSWLSGAKGYTYGAGDVPPKCPQGSGGLWRWVTDPQKHDFWEKALQWESAFQMQYLHDFLAATDWWQLEPAQELIRNQPDDVTRRMVLARMPKRDFAVAYLPDNEWIEVNLSAFSAPLVARWFDPVRGRHTPVPGSIKNQGVHRFTPPAKDDWVLVLEPPGLSSADKERQSNPGEVQGERRAVPATADSGQQAAPVRKGPAKKSQLGTVADSFRTRDRNGDGKISADEFPGPLFKPMDKDGDGFVTPTEAREYYRSRTARQPAPTAPPASIVSLEHVNAPPGPAPATPPVSASRAFTDLRFTRDGQPGTQDDRGQWISGTETMRFLHHGGKLFVSTGVWMDLPYYEAKGERPWTGPQILVKESAQTPWRLDMSFPLAIRVDAMISATFITDGTGRKLDPPVTLLIASPSSENTATWTRDDATGQWTESLAQGGLRGGLRSFCLHQDAGTKEQYLFGGSTKSGSIFRAVYDAAAPGRLRWHEAPELSGTGRVMCMTEANGVLYAACGIPSEAPLSGGLFRRVDGDKPRWELLWRWPHQIREQGDETEILRGLTAILDPKGGAHQVLLGTCNYPGVVYRIDPKRDFAVTTELDIRAYFAKAFGVPLLPLRSPCLSVYNNFLPVTDPDTGEKVHLLGLWINHPAGRTTELGASAWYLVRHADGTYGHGRAFDPNQPKPNPPRGLLATRTIEVSPFPEDQGRVLYFGGFDCANIESHNTAWIYKANQPAKSEAKSKQP